MSGLFGGASKATTHTTRAMGIDFQGAQYGPVIPVVYGRNKVPGNCVWYGDFQSHAQQQKAGKGGGGGSTTNYTYSASAQMGLCEGPGIALQTVYDGTSIVNLSSINYAFASGAIGQAPWSHLSGSAALGYSLTAIFSFQNLDLGSQASLPNYNYEVNGLKQFSGSIPDANPRDIFADICSDPYHGVNFPWIGSLTQYSNYCVANSLFLSPVYDQQQSANQALSDLFKYTNAYVYYSEDQLKVVPLGDTAVTGNGVTYTPNVTPIVNLGTDDFIADGTGATITVDRKAPQDNLNLVRVEFKDRSNTYHDSAVVAAIDEDIITNGGRSDDSETVNGCTNAAVARFVAQNLVQRAFYIRNTYQFKLTWRYCYLEPTDIVTLTDAALGLNLYPVRITEIDEDGDSALTITAEEFPEGIGHSAIYNTQPNGGTNIDQNADPGPVNAPFLFRGPGFLVGNNKPEIWCAVNGSEPMWAACDVYLSHDGSSYTFAGTVASQARYGQLTTALAAGSADPDTTNTPTVEVYAPAELLGGSQTDADNFVTLAMIDSEIIAYETATLQATETYKLGYLRRGGYGSTDVAHSIGAPFVRLDDSIFRMPVDPSLIGKTVWLKFLSINAFGRTPRTLADETAYQYVVGTNVELPDVPAMPDDFAVEGVADGAAITWTNDNPAATGCTSIEYATASAGPFTVLAQVGPTTTAYHHSFTTGATYWYRARARGPLPQSGWSDYTTALSSTGTNVNAISSTANTANSTANTATSLAQQVNVINPGFDAGNVGWNLDPGWTIKMDGAGPGQGQGYAQFTGSAGTPSGAIKNQALCFVTTGQTYKAQALIRAAGANGSGYVKIAWLDANLASVGVNDPGNVITGTATGGSYAVAQAPAGATYGQVWIEVDGCTAGTYQADNVVSNLQASSLAEVPDGNGRYAAVSDGPTQTAQAAQVATNVNNIALVAAPGANLLPNAGFQLFSASGPTGWGGTFGSSPPGFSNSPTGFFGSVATDPPNRLEFATNSTTPITPSVSSVEINIAPSTVFSISTRYAVVRSLAAGSFVMDVEYRTAAGAFISYLPHQFLSSTDTGGYIIAKFENLTAPSNAGMIRFRIYAENAASDGSGVVYLRVDWVKLEIGAQCTPYNDFATQFGNLLTVAGSQQTIGDQRNTLPVTWAGVRSVLSSSPITYSISGTTINFVVASVTVNGGGFTVSYNASSANVTQGSNTQATWYLYYRDRNSSGGTQTLYATRVVQDLAAYPDIVMLGYATVFIQSGGGGSPGGGSGGGGFCVCGDMWVDPSIQAKDAPLGYLFDCCDLPTSGTATFKRPMLAVEHEATECVRLTTARGAVLDCGITTPFDTIDGRVLRAPQMLDELVLTDDGLEQVVGVNPIGIRPVCFFHFGGISYAAGRDPSHRIYSHNPGAVKP